MTKDKETETVKKSTRAVRKTVDSTSAKIAATRKALPEPDDDDRVGVILRKERLKKGYELEDVAKKLCIRTGYMEAIESGNYKALPQMPYSAGFVSSYAKFLGLNHTRITQLFREEIHVKPKSIQTFLPEETATEASVPNKVYVITGLVIIALLAGLWSLLRPSSGDAGIETVKVEQEEKSDNNLGKVEYFNTEEEQKNIVEKSVEDAVNNEKAETESKNLPTIIVPQDDVASSQIIVSDESYVENSNKNAEEEGVEVKITSGDVWIEVRDANKIYLSKVMKAGSSYRLPKIRGLLLSAGKHVGVEVYVNGKLTPVIRRDRKMKIDVDGLLKANH